MGRSWLAELPAIKGARWEGFRRGIVAEVSFASFEAMRFNAHACRAAAPVEAVTVPLAPPEGGEDRGSPDRRTARVDAHRQARRGERRLAGRLAAALDPPPLTVLGLWAEALSILVASPHLAGLRALRLASNGLGYAGIRALTQAATLTALEELDLSGPGYYDQYYDDPIISTAGMASLAGWGGLARVRSLTLSGNDVRPAGLRALLRSPHAGALRGLSLRGGRLDGQAMAAFGDALPGMHLETLDLGENVLKDTRSGVRRDRPLPPRTESVAAGPVRDHADRRASDLRRKAPSLAGCDGSTSATTTSGRPGWPSCWGVRRRRSTRSGCATTTSSTRERYTWPGRRRRTPCSMWT